MCLKGGATCSENGRHKNSLPDSSSSRAAHGAVFDEPSEACDGMRSARAFSIECSLPALFQGRNRINRPEGISPTRRGIRHDVKCGPQGTASTPGPTGRHPLLHAFRTKTRRSIHDRQHDQEAFAPTSTAATKPSSAHFARGWAPSGASPRSSAFRAFPSTTPCARRPFSTSCARWRVPTSRASPCPSTAL